MTFDIEAIAAVLRQAAKTEVVPRFRKLSADAIRSKSEPSDLVTEGDEASERFIRAELARILPEAQFIGEESVAADPALLDTVFDAELSVMIDPIDGTANFVAGVPLFGVMASISRRGECVGGILYDPFADDFVLAEKGSGAFIMQPNGERVRAKVADPLPLAEMIGFASTGFLPPAQRQPILSNLSKVRMIACYRCAAHEYRTFTTGHSAFVMYSKLNPWDHLPGTLIAAEAGAHIACFDGSAYGPDKRSGGLLVAPDKDSWNLLMDEVFRIPA